jgi:hypothetical protein
MALDANALLAGLLVSSIGFVLMAYGRKTGRVVHVCTGLVLLIYPYTPGREPTGRLGPAAVRCTRPASDAGHAPR